jgi:hypothetical protein
VGSGVETIGVERVLESSDQHGADKSKHGEYSEYVQAQSDVHERLPV